MRTCCLLVLSCLACTEAEKPPLEVRIPQLPEGQTTLLMPEALLHVRREFQYRLEVRSNVDKTVQLAARLDEPAPAGMRVILARNSPIMRGSTGQPQLVMLPPKRLGRFSGTVTLYSDDLPGWTHSWAYEGEVLDKPLSGKYIRADPASVDLGNVKPGEKKQFFFALRNVGDADIVIEDFLVSDEKRIRLVGAESGDVIVPGGALQVNGVFTFPREAGRATARLRILSDAVNVPRGLTVVVSGMVSPDYYPNPPRLVKKAFATQPGSGMKIAILGREGTEPFFVKGVSGHERFLELAKQPSREPAKKHVVTFLLKRDAPTNATQPFEFVVRFDLDNGAEVLLPVKLTVYAPITPLPGRITLKWNLKTTKVPKSVVQLSSFGNLRYEVTDVRSKRGFLIVEASGGRGLSWKISVLPKPGLRPGVYDDEIIIATDYEDVPEVRVPVFLEVRD